MCYSPGKCSEQPGDAGITSQVFRNANHGIHPFKQFILIDKDKRIQIALLSSLSRQKLLPFHALLRRKTKQTLLVPFQDEIDGGVAEVAHPVEQYDFQNFA